MTNMPIAEDSFLIRNFLPENLSTVDCLEKEIQLNDFTISGKTLCRKGSFQGNVDAESTPWLRCPSIEGQTILPWTRMVLGIRDKIHETFGHDMNICKIQRYEDGKACIAPHADKILDLDEKVPIYNVRFGETRTFLLTNKTDRKIKIPVSMPHNSLFILGWKTNNRWLHSVPKQSINGPSRASWSVLFRKSVTRKHITSGHLFGPRTKYHCLDDLQKDILTGLLPFSDDGRELIRLYREENSRPINVQYLQQFAQGSY